MAVTYRQLINRVLTTLAETPIPDADPAITGSYPQLVGTFVNQIKEEIEDAHNWRSLRQNLSVTILANAFSGLITGANERSRVLRIADAERGYVPLVFDITDATNPQPLVEMDLADILMRQTMDPTATVGPAYFAVDNDDDGDPVLLVWPRPIANRTITIMMIVPQARLGNSDVNVALRIPVRALEIGSIYYALMERGEELGIQGIFSEERYRKALDDAISRDNEEQGGYEVIAV